MAKTEKKKKKDITKTDAWNSADWDYNGIAANDMMPLLSEPLRGLERLNVMKELLDVCPEYYPAMFDIGQNCMLMGKDNEAMDWFRKGFNILEEHFPNKNLIEAYDKTGEFLTKVFGYELAIPYYEKLIALQTEDKLKADAYDKMAECYAHLESIDKAIESQKKSVELNKSSTKYSNLGWMLMIKGDLDDAEEALKEALKLNKKDGYAKNNLEVCRLMKKEGIKTWGDYLLRKADCGYIQKLEDDELFDKLDKYVAWHNMSKLEAFKSELLKNPKYTLAEKHDIFISLRHFLNFIYDLEHDTAFLYDNASEVEVYFKKIMHKFIFKTRDIDEKIFNNIYAGLLEFYKFLQKNKLVSASEYKDLKSKMAELKPELKEKMLEYNKVRHNPDYSEEEKEEVREELFEGDHEWWFL